MRLLYHEDGGHGMIFKDFSGKLMLTMHYPNTNDLERPVISELSEESGRL